MLALLALVVVLALVWFGRDWLPGEPLPPTPPPVVTPAPKPAATQQATAPAPDALIGQVFEATGISRSIDAMQQRIGVSIETFGAYLRLGPEQQQLIHAAQLEAFPPDALRDRLQERFKAQFNEAQLRTLLADFNGPVARRMKELAAAGASDEQAFVRFVEQMRTQPLSDKRQALLQRLDRAIGAGQWTVEMTLDSARAMLQAASAAGGKRVADVEGELATLRATLEPRIRESFVSRLAYAYREATDDELAALAAIYESPEGKWYTENVWQVMREHFQDGQQRFAGRLAEVFASQPRPTAQATAQPPGSPEAGSPSGEETGTPARLVRRPTRWHLDARACLQYERPADVARCAQKYF
ncbi:hypothetical protein [Accumulibacter sp.]|uniref:hypothetical protein n=1 Tax=Accumulibacter sp. TaxID=2053492 RepID=UPI0025D2F1F6|nr:hypothetical protein [Accumulibacter sp.]MCM8594734.1 hypothetical protein [Accumulibacter sp.]MDS4048880.1 hypothetical protein [Accumulibacter sp.]